MRTYIATNPKTNDVFTATAKSKDDFLLTLVKKAPIVKHWYPDEVRECVEKDLIEEVA